MSTVAERAELRERLGRGEVSTEEFTEQAGFHPAFVCRCGAVGWHRCSLIYGPFPRRSWREAHNRACVSNRRRACRGGGPGACRRCPFDPNMP